MHLLAEQFDFLGDDDLGFLKEGARSQNLSNGTNFAT